MTYARFYIATDIGKCRWRELDETGNDVAGVEDATIFIALLKFLGSLKKEDILSIQTSNNSAEVFYRRSE